MQIPCEIPKFSAEVTFISEINQTIYNNGRIICTSEASTEYKKRDIIALRAREYSHKIFGSEKNLNLGKDDRRKVRENHILRWQIKIRYFCRINIQEL